MATEPFRPTPEQAALIETRREFERQQRVLRDRQRRQRPWTEQDQRDYEREFFGE